MQIPYSQLLMQSQCLGAWRTPGVTDDLIRCPINPLWSQQKKKATKIAASPASAVRVLSSRS